MKKCNNTNTKGSGIIKRLDKRRSSANGSNTSTVGAVTSLILMFVFALLAHHSASATSGLTISISSDSLATDMFLDSSNGSFKDSGNLNISVATTSSIGYTLSIASSNSVGTPAPLINTSNSSLTIPSITSNVSATDFSANSSTGASYNDKWGYKPSKYNSTANTTNYYPGPTTSGDVLNITNTANPTDGQTSNLVSDNYTISFGTRISKDTAPGTYSNTFVITAVANAAEYTINYYANTSDTVSGLPANEASYAVGNYVNLSTNLPTRDGYVFMGWCTNNASETSCSGTNYSRGSTYPITESVSNDIDLYAIWGQTLYNKVASLVKTTNGTPRTQTLADMQAVITTPTSNNPATDTSNSGVYLYDAETYGIASDASNDYPIYYYRGILDSAFDRSDDYGGIPSSGNGYYYPNYIKLGDHCWRIVRTTGSGGTKMIYNGSWSGGTTANSCANAGNNANAISSVYLNRGTSELGDDHYGTDGFITYAGYNYNSTYAYNNIQHTSAVNNSTLFSNETPSNLRTTIEAWFNDNISGYDNILENSAGYCDDRSTPKTQTIPYSNNNITYFNGVYRAEDKISLTCPNTTGNDILTTENGLTNPIALLTGDEIFLAGHGRTSNSSTTIASIYASNFSHGSYLRSGRYFWLLAPFGRSIANNHYVTSERIMYIDGSAGNTEISAFHMVRPAVSLTHDVTVAGGSGTATDPWTIDVTFDTAFAAAGKSTYGNTHYYAMQDMTPGVCSAVSTNQTATLIDSRDGTLYSVGKALDGNCWMLQNLKLGKNSDSLALNSSTSNVGPNGFTLNGKSADGKFTYETVDGVEYQNNNSQYYCTDNYGCYYNWYTATAGSGTTYVAEGNADYDICPIGWRISNSNELITLSNNYTSASQMLVDNPITTTENTINKIPGLLLSGYYLYSGDSDLGSRGLYWSRTSAGTRNAYYTDITESDIHTNSSVKSFGFPVRCLAQTSE